MVNIKDTCPICKEKFKDEDVVVPLMIYNKDEERGDWVSGLPQGVIHLRHLWLDTIAPPERKET